MPHSPPPSELQHRLRQATKQAHHVLDHHPLLAPLLTAKMRVDQYGDALSALHPVYHWAEHWIDAYLSQQAGWFDYASRRKLPALEADLMALGRLPAASHLNAVKIAPGQGALIGILYTVEGSTMGGQVIARLLRQFSGPALPMQFYTGYGDQSRQKWQAFLSFADAECPRPEYPAASAAAVAFFEAISIQLDAVWAEMQQTKGSPLTHNASEAPRCAPTR